MAEPSNNLSNKTSNKKIYLSTSSCFCFLFFMYGAFTRASEGNRARVLQKSQAASVNGQAKSNKGRLSPALFVSPAVPDRRRTGPVEAPLPPGLSQ
jgi:hypothetical protein